MPALVVCEIVIEVAGFTAVRDEFVRAAGRVEGQRDVVGTERGREGSRQFRSVGESQCRGAREAGSVPVAPAGPAWKWRVVVTPAAVVKEMANASPVWNFAEFVGSARRPPAGASFDQVGSGRICGTQIGSGGGGDLGGEC